MITVTAPMQNALDQWPPPKISSWNSFFYVFLYGNLKAHNIFLNSICGLYWRGLFGNVISKQKLAAEVSSTLQIKALITFDWLMKLLLRFPLWKLERSRLKKSFNIFWTKSLDGISKAMIPTDFVQTKMAPRLKLPGTAKMAPQCILAMSKMSSRCI